MKRLIQHNQKLNSTVGLLTIKFLILLDKSLHRRRSLNRDLFVPHLELLTIKFLILMDKSFHRRGRLNTVDLLVQSSLNQLLLVINNDLPFYKTSHLSATYRTFSPKICRYTVICRYLSLYRNMSLYVVLSNKLECLSLASLSNLAKM